eukprot:6206265-Pleurochrysis_carterae.AAC.3
MYGAASKSGNRQLSLCGDGSRAAPEPSFEFTEPASFLRSESSPRTTAATPTRHESHPSAATAAAPLQPASSCFCMCERSSMLTTETKRAEVRRLRAMPRASSAHGVAEGASAAATAVRFGRSAAAADDAMAEAR